MDLIPDLSGQHQGTEANRSAGDCRFRLNLLLGE
jgi:hypothetical protein